VLLPDLHFPIENFQPNESDQTLEPKFDKNSKLFSQTFREIYLFANETEIPAADHGDHEAELGIPEPADGAIAG